MLKGDVVEGDTVRFSYDRASGVRWEKIAGAARAEAETAQPGEGQRGRQKRVSQVGALGFAADYHR